MDQPNAPETTQAQKPRRWLRSFLFWGLLGCAGFIAYQIVRWPDIAALAHGPVWDSAFMRNHRGGPILQKYVPLRQISWELQSAVVVAEDIRFFSHTGFDTHEIANAMRDVFTSGRMRGASTLSQQLVKNLFLSESRNPWRKIKEALLTKELENKLPKRRILELYLNVAQFGPDVFGAEAAAQHYFHKPAKDLDSEEAAALAAALPQPKRWYPGVRSAKYTAKVERILLRMDKHREMLGRNL